MLICSLMGFSSDHIHSDDDHFLISCLYEAHASTEFYSSIPNNTHSKHQILGSCSVSPRNHLPSKG